MTDNGSLWAAMLQPSVIEVALIWAHLVASIVGLTLACWALWSAIGDYHAYDGEDKSTRLEGTRAVRNEALHICQQALMLAVATLSLSNRWWSPVMEPSVRVVLIIMTVVALIGAAANRKDRARQYQYAAERERRRGERHGKP